MDETVLRALSQRWVSPLFVDTLGTWMQLREWSETAKGEVATAQAAAEVLPRSSKIKSDREARMPAVGGRVCEWRPGSAGWTVWADEGSDGWHLRLRLPDGHLPSDTRPGARRVDVDVEIHGGRLAQVGHVEAAHEVLAWASQLGHVEVAGVSRLDLAVDVWCPPGEWGWQLLDRIVCRSRGVGAHRGRRGKVQRKPAGGPGRDREGGSPIRAVVDRNADLELAAEPDERPELDFFRSWDGELESFWFGSSATGRRANCYDKIRQAIAKQSWGAAYRWARSGWAGVDQDGALRPEVLHLYAQGWRMVRFEFQIRGALLGKLRPPGAARRHEGETLADLSRFLYADGLKWLWREMVGSAREHGWMRVVEPTHTRKKMCRVAPLWEAVRGVVEAEPDGAGLGERAERFKRVAPLSRQAYLTGMGQLRSVFRKAGLSFDEGVMHLARPEVRAEEAAKMERERLRERGMLAKRTSLEDVRRGVVPVAVDAQRAAPVPRDDGDELVAELARLRAEAVELRRQQRANLRALRELEKGLGTARPAFPPPGEDAA